MAGLRCDTCGRPVAECTDGADACERYAQARADLIARHAGPCEVCHPAPCDCDDPDHPANGGDGGC